jgi:hypothetical protein
VKVPPPAEVDLDLQALRRRIEISAATYQGSVRPKPLLKRALVIHAQRYLSSVGGRITYTANSEEPQR